MTITYHYDVEQGSEEWLAMRCGILTASEIKLIVTPSLKIAYNEKERAHMYELLGQRITKYVEPRYISDDMLRGQWDEVDARAKYSEHYAPVRECGFVTNDDHGFIIGYSPDGLVGDDGLIECKSRRQRFQVETIVRNAVPSEYMLQLQTGLLVTGREWIDFVSYCGGMPMFIKRVFPDAKIIETILTAAMDFEERVEALRYFYPDSIKSMPKLIETERTNEQEITL